MPPLSISTWNISQSEANPQKDIWQKSSASPPDFSCINAIEAISDTILSWKSDIIILQELPSPDSWCHLGRLESLYVGGSFCALTHCGFTSVLLSRDLLKKVKVYEVDIVGPTVIVSICDRNPEASNKISIIGAHLSPFKNGSSHRLHEITEAIRVAKCHGSSSIVFGGDLNMRNDEMKNIQKIGLRDAFLALGSPKESSVTWDSSRNKYHKDGFPFRCRFDRFLFLGDIKPVSIDTGADTPIGGNIDHYLSDHFSVRSEWVGGR